jgi:two-component system osmolarity sensor histidine kinase EnvZ
MRFTPRTLAGRTVLLVFIAVMLSEVLTFFIHGHYRRIYEFDRVSDVLTTNVRMLQTVIGNLPPAGREALMRDTEHNRYRIAVRGDHDVPADASLSAPMAEIAERLQQRLGPDTVVQTISQEQLLRVSFTAADGRWWLIAARPPPTPHMPWHMLAALGAICGIALGLSAAFALHIVRPLRDLTGAAEALAAGQPRPAKPGGPEEVRVLAQTFNRMLDALQESERERRTMLAGLPHDLRAPLARLKLRATLTDDPELNKALSRDAEDMARIVDQFLAYLRGEAEEAIQLQSLDAIAREAIDAQRVLGRTVALHNGTATKLPLRPIAIRRLIDNLLDNAFQHGAPPVGLAIEQENDSVVLSVRDSGNGIPATERTRAQQPFEQLDKARGAAGCGLGLAIVERIARAHGGGVTLADAPGGGLNVSVVLPLQHPN